MEVSVSVGIITYNSAKTIDSTLSSLSAAASAFPGEVRVLIRDNGSQDETVSLIQRAVKAQPARIVIVLGGDNIGYGRGHNAILGRTKAPIHVICNPDIVVGPDFFARSRAFLEANPDVGLMSPRMTWGDGTLQHANRRHPTVLDLALRRFAPGVIRAACKGRMARYEMADVGYDRVVDVPFCSGALMVCRRAALDAVGGFDDRYFLYFEDADLSRMLQGAGWRTVYNPDVAVIHGWQRAAHRSRRIAFVMIRNAMRYFSKWGWRVA
ncbi:glycosyltransferase family 2 protein [Aurantimonas sp. C2-6-R+9]|uniref:glycosyltransferase family 2 protein n=1 Tax=unclassified Aurantimonas TaxID=2638230 RepID=UPI002E170677|nr:glycosyltransferase family 2 protein [Aurantimonas sp. C2-6-R+9]